MGTASMGKNAFGPGVAARYSEGLVGQGISAELIAARWRFDRTALDEFSARSHARAAAADFSSEILPVAVGSDTQATTDETVRPSTDVNGLAGLKPSFYDERLAQRFPEIDWRITPGNSSPLTDGASAVLMKTARNAGSLRGEGAPRIHAEIGR